MTNMRISSSYRLTCKSNTTNLTQDKTRSQNDSVFKASRVATVIMDKYPNFAGLPCWVCACAQAHVKPMQTSSRWLSTTTEPLSSSVRLTPNRRSHSSSALFLVSCPVRVDQNSSVCVHQQHVEADTGGECHLRFCEHEALEGTVSFGTSPFELYGPRAA
jgi:hypothetical protein